MQNLRKRMTVAVAVLATFAFAGVVVAAEDGDDTVVNYGYDEDSRFFMLNVTSLDYAPYREAIDDDEVEAGDIETLLAMCGLALDGDPVEYGYTFDGEAISLFETDESGQFDPEDIPYDTSTCGGFIGDVVTGPAGQVNHGMFMKTLNSLFDGPRKGCIVRHIAGSSLGKDDQQVLANEDDVATEGEQVEIEGTATFSTVSTDCQKGKDRTSSDEDGVANRKGGPPQHVLDKFDEDHPRNAKGKNKVKSNKSK